MPVVYRMYIELPKVFTLQLPDRKNPDINTEENVFNVICQILSHIICKNTGVLEELIRM